MTNSTIGQRIAEQRKKLGLSQEALGEKLSISRQAISKWESDSAIPEIDKLIALSKLFGVSVGWLLGVEEQPKPEDSALSGSQLALIDQIVKKYTPTPLVTKWQQILAICLTASIFICLFAMQITNIRQQNLISSNEVYSLTLAAQIEELKKQQESLNAQISALSASVPSSYAPGQLLAGYSLEPYPLAATKSGRRVKVSFSAVPHIWNTGDTGYICVSGPGDPFRIKCDWDGGHLTAELILEIEDGYDLCFAVEHSDNSQEQQLLEHETIENLAEAFTIPIRVERGSVAYENGAVVLTDYTARFGMPAIYELIKEGHAIAQCEYRLYRRPNNDSKIELLQADVLPSYTNDPIPGYPFRASPPEVRFENVDIKNCNHMNLCFYIKLDNGVEREYPITVFIPDGQGSLKE